MGRDAGASYASEAERVVVQLYSRRRLWGRSDPRVGVGCSPNRRHR
jgi:hypothetical protein